MRQPIHQCICVPVFLISLFSASICSAATGTGLPYAKYCNSVVSESTLTGLAVSSYKLRLSNDYFTGGNSLFSIPSDSDKHFNTRVYSFYAHDVLETHTPGVLKVVGELLIHGEPSAQAQSHLNYNHNTSRHISRLGFPYGVIHFELSGFWSVAAGMVCLVGQSIVSYHQQGSLVPFSVVMKASYPNNSNIFNSLAAGTIESLDTVNSPNYFDVIYFTGLVENNYQYTMISKANETCSHLELDEESLSLEHGSLCYFVDSYLNNKFILQYGRDCDGGTCNPLGRRAEFLPKFMFLKMRKCSDDGNLGFHVDFASSDNNFASVASLVAGKSLIGEGYWDQKKNRLCTVACHIQKDNSPLNVSVGDCNIGLCFWFPSVLSIKRRSPIVGRIWNTNKIDEVHTSTVSLSLLERDVLIYPPHSKYMYTELDAALKLCKMASVINSTNTTYPASAKDMSLRMLLRDLKGNTAYGLAQVVSIGETCFGGMYTSKVQKELNSTEMGDTWTVSYKLPIYMSNYTENSEISAEGIYNVQTGMLCMIGCQYVPSQLGVEQVTNLNYSDSMDCSIQINIQLLPSKAGTGNYSSTGTIRSLRKETDPLYFEYTVEASPLYDRISGHVINLPFGSALDMKVDTSIMLVLSLTISCMCFLAQLFHVKKHLIFIPSISVAWFVILNLTAFIPLLLNFEYLFYVDKSLLSDQHSEDFWLVMTRVIVGLLLIAVLLLQFCLLYAIWSKRPAVERKEQQAAAKDKILFHVILYLSGGLISWFFQYHTIQTHRSRYDSSLMDLLLDDLASYACLVLDGFLLPQLILNTFWNPREQAFTPLFYLGTTLLQALPHFSNTYILQKYVKQLRIFYSFLIPGQALVLALVLFLLRESESSLYRKQFKHSAVRAVSQIEAI